MTSYTPPQSHNINDPYSLAPLAGERASALELQSQSARFSGMSLFWMMLNALPNVLMVLNRQRQVVFSNQAMFDLLRLSPDEIVGMRPGEVWGCAHAASSPGGCGTSEACKVCGAAQAIVASSKGAHSVQDCRIIQHDGGALDLRVWSSPIMVEGEQFLIVTVQDISAEKRRDALESIFFHDVLNLAGVLLGYAEMLDMTTDPQDTARIRRTLVQTSLRLSEEISMQRDLLTAERGNLVVHPINLKSSTVMSHVLDRYRDYNFERVCTLRIAPEAADVTFESDPVLVERVLGNMVKNALEASDNGQTVTINCSATDHDISFSVHNERVMPYHVKLQVFQRSFSTKGTGRGLGTYSMKLLTEQYLHGTISFSTLEAHGTTFQVTYPLVFPDLHYADEPGM